MKNLTFFHLAMDLCCVAIIIGVSFGFAKYYGTPVILDKNIDVYDSMALVFSAVWLGLKATVYGRLIK